MDSETKKLQVALQADVTTSYRLQAGVSSGLWSMVFGLFVQQFRVRFARHFLGNRIQGWLQPPEDVLALRCALCKDVQEGGGTRRLRRLPPVLP